MNRHPSDVGSGSSNGMGGAERVKIMTRRPAIVKLRPTPSGVRENTGPVDQRL